MNPGIGAPELIILVILALVVVGPKDLPLMMRKAGRAMGQVRAMAREFQRNFDELGREAELAELRKEVDALKKANPLSEMEAEVRAAEADLRAADRPHPRTASATRSDTAQSAGGTSPETSAETGGEINAPDAPDADPGKGEPARSPDSRERDPGRAASG